MHTFGNTVLENIFTKCDKVTFTIFQTFSYIALTLLANSTKLPFVLLLIFHLLIQFLLNFDIGFSLKFNMSLSVITNQKYFYRSLCWLIEEYFVLTGSSLKITLGGLCSSKAACRNVTSCEELLEYDSRNSFVLGRYTRKHTFK